MSNIENVLSSLKSRLNEKNDLTIQASDGYLIDMKFKFHPPVDKDVINSHENLPEDYKNFLLLHNGADFFCWEYGNLFSIYSLEQSLSQLEQVRSGNYVPLEYKDDWFPIGYVQDIGGLYIDLSSEKDNIMLIGIPIVNMLCNLPTWLDRMIQVNGALYWEWASKEL